MAGPQARHDEGGGRIKPVREFLRGTLLQATRKFGRVQDGNRIRVGGSHGRAAPVRGKGDAVIAGEVVIDVVEQNLGHLRLPFAHRRVEGGTDHRHPVRHHPSLAHLDEGPEILRPHERNQEILSQPGRRFGDMA